MSIRMRSLLMLGGLAVAAFAAPNLRASNTAFAPSIPIIRKPPSSGPVIPFDPCFFDGPDLGKCNDASWRASTCGQKAVSDCVTIRQNEYKTEWANNNNTQAIIAPSGFSNTKTATNGKVVPFDSGNHVKLVRSADFNYGSIVGLSRLPSSLTVIATNPVLFGANTAPLHPEWEENGGSAEVHSCQEYTYKKWYDYSRFEDAAATCKGYAPCIYDLAMQTATPGLNHPLAKRTLTANEPIPASLPNPPAADQIKNPWFTPSISGRPTSVGVFHYWVEKHASTATNYQIQAAWGQSPPYHITNRWQWHQQMHDAQAQYGLTEDAFASIEERTARYVDLLQKFATLDAGMLKFQPSIRTKYLNPGMFDKCGNFKTIPGGGSNVGGLPPGPQPQPNPACDGPYVPPSYVAGNDSANYYYSLLDQIGAMVAAEWNHQDPRNGTVDHGCLDPSSNRCDWSPKQFASEYVGLFQNEREADFKKCVFWTANQFQFATPAMSAADTADADGLERWYVTANTAVQEVEKELPFVAPHGTNQFGNTLAGGHTIGDTSWFAADYGYNATWHAKFNTDPQGNLCGTTGDADGALHANVYMLGAKFTIIDAELGMDAGQNGDTGGNGWGHLIVANDVKWSQSKTHVDGQTAIHYAYSDTPFSPHAGVAFPVLGVLVEISAGASVSLGASFDAKAYGPAGCSPIALHNTPGTLPILSMQAGAGPFVAVNADVSAAIDAAVITVGVRGTLNLITASVPLQSNVTVGYDTQSGSAVLMLATKSSLELSELSGNVKAFGELCLGPICEDAEVGLFSWDGMHQSFPIFDHQNTWQLFDVQRALAIHTGH